MLFPHVAQQMQKPRSDMNRNETFTFNRVGEVERWARLLTSIALATLLAGCASLNGHSMAGASLNDEESTPAGQIDTGLRGYHEIFSDSDPL